MQGEVMILENIQSVFTRMESKYLLGSDEYQAVLTALGKHMQEDEYGAYTICNIYFDTEDFALARNSIEKPLYKEKLRLRSYGVPDQGSPVFVELKKKFQGVVYKRREEMPLHEAKNLLLHGMRTKDSQILREISAFLSFYRPVPKLCLSYDRTAFWSPEDPGLRVTFDSRIRCRDSDLDLTKGAWGRALLEEGQYLMEIKALRAMPLWLARLLSECGIYPTSFSKYGTCYVRYLYNKWLPQREAAKSANSAC